MSAGSPEGRFPTTNWSLIWDAGDEHAQDRRAAVDQLLRSYWPALTTHLVVHKRINPHDAEDLVQGFIAAKVLERNLVGTAQPERGRFRSLLLKSLDNFVANQMEKRSAQKRQADRAVAIDPQQESFQDSAAQPPERVFDIEWARQLINHVTERMQAECDSSERADVWGVFEARILLPATAGSPVADYESLVAQFGFRSPSQASNTLITGKRMFTRILRSVVAEYCADREDAEAEIRDLKRILSSA